MKVNKESLRPAQKADKMEPRTSPHLLDIFREEETIDDGILLLGIVNESMNVVMGGIRECAGPEAFAHLFEIAKAIKHVEWSVNAKSRLPRL